MILLWSMWFRKICKLVAHHFLCERPFTVGIFFSPLSPFIILPLKSTFLWKLFTQHSRLFWFHYWTISKPFFLSVQFSSVDQLCLTLFSLGDTYFPSVFKKTYVHAHTSCGHVHVCVLNCVRFFHNLMDCSLPVSSLHGFIPAYLLPFPPPGDLLDAGIEPTSSVSAALAGWFFTTEAFGKPVVIPCPI